MKLFILLSAISMLILSASDCSKKKAATGKYKGRLEIKGICLNYTIQLLEGSIDTSRIAAKWTDEVTNKSYTDVFALENPCYFPDSIKQGDEFYFRIDTSADKGCIKCLAYYPTPPKRLPIIVVEK
jgi:hypothetical protein